MGCCEREEIKMREMSYLVAAAVVGEEEERIKQLTRVSRIN